jgi:DeoR family transcriptional regulator of aga operon
MLSIAERHKIILDKLGREGFIKVIDIANELEVTTVTIRKDLKILEDKGLLYRTHGSASPVNPFMTDRHVTEKEKLHVAEKERIAYAAAALIEKDDTIIINSGSTIFAFIDKIKPVGTLTIVTPCVKATLGMCDMENVNIFQLGGMFHRRSLSVVGNYSHYLLNEISCSKLFLGVDGIDTDWGVTTSNIVEAELNKEMMKAAAKTILLCDSSKFGRRGFGKICNLDSIDIVITDDGISSTMLKTLEEHGVKVIIA